MKSWAPANLQFKGFGRIHLAHFSAFRLLLEEDGTDGLRFKTDPIALFEEKKTELSSTIQNTFESQGRVVQQVGKATDAWIRLEGQLQNGNVDP